MCQRARRAQPSQGHRLLQPSDYRTEELKVPWDEEALLASQRPIAREDKSVSFNADGSKPRPRFDPNPKASGFLEEFPESRFRSIFQQTEEGMAAEHDMRVEGAINTWRDRIVVDDPVLHIDLRSRDKAPQQEKMTGLLKDKAMKASLRSLYRGKNALTYGNNVAAEPSAFVHESTIDEIAKFESTLRPHDPSKWSGTKAGLSGTRADFTATVRKQASTLSQTAESRRAISLLSAAEKSGPLFQR